MKRWGSGILTAGATLLIVAVAPAHTTSYKTTLVEDNNVLVQNERLFFGHLESPNDRCLPGRTVKLVGHYPDGHHKTLDTDRSSRNGYWAVGGDLDGVGPGTHLAVTRKNVGRHGHHHVCRADTAPVGG